MHRSTDRREEGTCNPREQVLQCNTMRASRPDANRRNFPLWWKTVALCLISFWLGMTFHGIAHSLEHHCEPVCALCCIVAANVYAVEVPTLAPPPAPAPAAEPPIPHPEAPYQSEYTPRANLVRGPPPCC